MTSARQTPLRVLIVAAREPWPLNSGGRLHLYHVTRELARYAWVTLALPHEPLFRTELPDNVNVVAMSATADAASREAVRGRNLPWVSRLARRHFGPRDAVSAWVRRHAQREFCDVVMLNGAVNGQFAPLCRVPAVWNPQDELVLRCVRDIATQDWPEKLATLKRAAFYAVYERQVARHCRTTVYVSSVDASWARRWTGSAGLAVIQNGVASEFYEHASAAPEPGAVVFVGALDFPPNIDGITHFVRTAWPTIHAADATRRLRIVGRRPCAAVRALAAVPGVELHADVPDVRPYLAQASVAIVPVRTGGGLKNKILEACAAGRPVVATPIAAGGLSARHGRELLLATRPTTWIRVVDRLLRCPEDAARLGAAGQTWVRAAHDWRRTGWEFLAVLAAAARRANVVDPPGNEQSASRAPHAAATCTPARTEAPACR